MLTNEHFIKIKAITLKKYNKKATDEIPSLFYYTLAAAAARFAVARTLFCLFSRGGIHAARPAALRLGSASRTGNGVFVRLYQLFEFLPARGAFVLQNRHCFLR